MPQLKLKICRNEFHVSCAAGDEGLMREAANIVEEYREKLRGKTKTADGERLALMTALQIAFELSGGGGKKNSAGQLAAASKQLHKQIDDTLERTNDSLHKRALNGVNQ